MVQDKQTYTEEPKCQLNNTLHYTKVAKDSTVQVAKASNKLVEHLHGDDHIDDTTLR